MNKKKNDYLHYNKYYNCNNKRIKCSYCMIILVLNKISQLL